FLNAYEPLMSISNVRLFTEQVGTLRRLVGQTQRADATDMHAIIAMGQCLATIAYAELIAENSLRLNISEKIVSAVFHLLVRDVNAAAIALGSLPQMDEAARASIRQLVTIAGAHSDDWDFV